MVELNSKPTANPRKYKPATQAGNLLAKISINMFSLIDLLVIFTVRVPTEVAEKADYVNDCHLGCRNLLYPDAVRDAQCKTTVYIVVRNHLPMQPCCCC